MRMLLLMAACLCILPLSGNAQRIPKPTYNVVGNFCPNCQELIPGATLPSKCPRCKFSFSGKPSPSSPSKKGNVVYPWPPSKPQLQPVDRFAGYLFYDVPIRPEDGKLKPVHLDPDGLAARAEATGKEMRQRYESRQQEQQRKFEMEKEALLKNRPEGAATGQLRNVFADDSAWDDAGTVDLRHLKNGRGVVGSLKEFDPLEHTFDPPSPQTPNKLNDMSNFSDEQLESMRQAYIRQLKGTQMHSEDITALHNENQVMIQENENQALSDAKDVINKLPGKNVFGKSIPDIPVELTDDPVPKPKPSLVEEGIKMAIEALEYTPIPDGSPLKKPLEITADTLKTGVIAGHAANAISTDVYVLSSQTKLDSQLEQNEQNRKLAFEKLKAVVEEQNHRKSVSTVETKSRTDPIPVPPSKLIGDSGWRELPIDPKWIIKDESDPSQ